MYTTFIFMHKRIAKIQIALLLSTKTLAFSSAEKASEENALLSKVISVWS